MGHRIVPENQRDSCRESPTRGSRRGIGASESKIRELIVAAKVSKEAAEELEEAAAWYEAEQPGLAVKLNDVFEHVIQLLKEPFPP